MLTLGEEQSAASIDIEKKSRLEEIISIIKEMHGETYAKLSTDEFRFKVINAFEKALVYEFTIDEHIIEFINLLFIWGDDFDISEKTSWGSEILSWKDATSEAKIRGLITKSEYELDRKLDHK